MIKRLVTSTGIVALTGGMFMGLTATPAQACFNTTDPLVELSCSTTCPSPTRPRAAVYVDGHWVVVCA